MKLTYKKSRHLKLKKSYNKNRNFISVFFYFREPIDGLGDNMMDMSLSAHQLPTTISGHSHAHPMNSSIHPNPMMDPALSHMGAALGGPPMAPMSSPSGCGGIPGGGTPPVIKPDYDLTAL